MRNNSVLLVVDAQNDFMPGGSLAIPDGDKIIPVINSLLNKFDLVIFTQDWHPEDMTAFASNHKGKNPLDKYKTKKGEEDILWPDHCINNSFGAKIHKDIKISSINGDFYFFKKGLTKDDHPYSGFGAEGLELFLNERGIKNVYVCGLATDYCSGDTALDAAFLGFKTFFVKDGNKGLSENLAPTYLNLWKNYIEVIESWEI